MLAICRGMQILNVACHGTICQDIELRKEPSINHMQTSISRKDISHKVNTVAGSRLHRIIGEFAYTNSFHHQVIEEVGEALQVTGRTADGVIEAIEMPSHPFVLGYNGIRKACMKFHQTCAIFFAHLCILRKNKFAILVHHTI